jgi:molecular chaperone GrpE
MTTDNTEKHQELDDKTIEQNANAEQLVTEEPLETNQDQDNPSLELEREKEKFLRLFAEFENYKKRTVKERIDMLKTANQEVLVALLPVMDDFDRAVAELTKSADEQTLKGVTLIHEKLKSTLASKGLEVVDLNAGDAFNPDFAEAITQIPAASDDLKGKIVDVLEKGYKLGERIIRFPKVVIGQ